MSAATTSLRRAPARRMGVAPCRPGAANLEPLRRSPSTLSCGDNYCQIFHAWGCNVRVHYPPGHGSDLHAGVQARSSAARLPDVMKQALFDGVQSDRQGWLNASCCWDTALALIPQWPAHSHRATGVDHTRPTPPATANPGTTRWPTPGGRTLASCSTNRCRRGLQPTKRPAQRR